MTTAGSTLGTLAYMAPERFDGGQSDPRSDVYALTCVLYECLTGSRPYPSDSLEQQIAGHMVSAPPRPSTFDQKLAAFDDVIAKGMAKKPQQRYQSAAELASAARRASTTPVRAAHRSGRHSAARHPTAPGRRPSRRVLAIASAVVLVAAVGTFGAWQLSGGRDTRKPVSPAVPSRRSRLEFGCSAIDCGDGAGGHFVTRGAWSSGSTCRMPPTSSRTPMARSSASTST